MNAQTFLVNEWYSIDCAKGYETNILYFCLCEDVEEMYIDSVKVEPVQSVVNWAYLANLPEVDFSFNGITQTGHVITYKALDCIYRVGFVIDDNCAPLCYDCPKGESCSCECDNIIPCNTDCSTGNLEVFDNEICECVLYQISSNGCTDITACNYDPFSNCDDGSCIYESNFQCNTDCSTGNLEVFSNEQCDCILLEVSVFGCNDATACNYDPLANCDDASCNFGNTACPDPCNVLFGCNDAAACNYDPSANCDDGSCNFGNTACPDPCNVLFGCNDADACNYDPLANCDDGSCNFGNTACPDPCNVLFGCNDAAACNYDPLANCDDGSCNFGNTACSDPCNVLFGCNDAAACNYDPSANCDDGSCNFGNTACPDPCNVLLGCNDAAACNYDPSANCDDGSCNFGDGCNDAAACNYDPSANCDDGSCVYCPIGGICENGDCFCPDCNTDILVNGISTCVNVCGSTSDSLNCPDFCESFTCPDGSLVVDCFECYCVDLELFVDFSTSMSFEGITGQTLMAETLQGVGQLIQNLGINYPNKFSLTVYSYSSQEHAGILLECVIVNENNKDELSDFFVTEICNDITAYIPNCGVNSSCTCGNTYPFYALQLAEPYEGCVNCTDESTIPMLLIMTDGSFNESSSMINTVENWFNNLPVAQQINAQTVGIQFASDEECDVSDGMKAFGSYYGGPSVYCGNDINDLFSNAIELLCNNKCVQYQDLLVCNPCDDGELFLNGICSENKRLKNGNCSHYFSGYETSTEYCVNEFINIECSNYSIDEICYSKCSCEDSFKIPFSNTRSDGFLEVSVCAPICDIGKYWNFVTNNCEFICEEGYMIYVNGECKQFIDCNDENCINIVNDSINKKCYCND